MPQRTHPVPRRARTHPPPRQRMPPARSSAFSPSSSPAAKPPPRPCWPVTLRALQAFRALRTRALPARASSVPHEGIARADHFRAGSITKTFIATVVLQLAAEHRLSLSDSVDAHLPGLVRGAGNDGRRLTLRSLLTHTSGLFDFTADTRGAVPSPRARPYASRSPILRPPAANSPTRTPTTSCSAWSSARPPATRTPPRPSGASSTPPSDGHLLPRRPHFAALPARPRVRRRRLRRHRPRPARGRCGG